MEHGDLGTVETTLYVVVLEGVLTTPVRQRHLIDRNRYRPASEWGWNLMGLKQIAEWNRLGAEVEVVSFISPEVAEDASEFLLRHDVPVGGVTFYGFDTFCSLLPLRLFRLRGVFDSDPERIQNYGQAGVLTPAMGVLPPQ